MTSAKEFTEFATIASPRLRRTAFLLCGNWRGGLLLWLSGRGLWLLLWLILVNRRGVLLRLGPDGCLLGLRPPRRDRLRHDRQQPAVRQPGRHGRIRDFDPELGRVQGLIQLGVFRKGG